MIAPLRWIAGISLILALSANCDAATINWDQIFYNTGDLTAAQGALLDGDITMTVSGSTLTITLRNTTGTAFTTAGASNLLTGIAFDLQGNSVTGGSVSMAGSTAINFTAPADNLVSKEYGYDNPLLDSGTFSTKASLYGYNFAVSAMESGTETRFDSSGSLGQPPDLDGPDFGLAANNGGNWSSILGNGVEGILDQIVITLNLASSVSDGDAFLAAIEAGNVALSFGSPGDTPGVNPPEGGPLLPEPASIVAWILGAGGLGLILRRRASKIAA